MKTFFIVCKDTSQMYASRRHVSQFEAVAEAVRLAKKERKQFFVFACFKAVCPVAPEVEVKIETCE